MSPWSRGWRRAELTQHRRDLPAVVRRVIDDVLQHVPEDRAHRFAAQNGVLDDPVHVVRRQFSYKTPHARLLLGPPRADVVHGFEIGGGQMAGGRIALPAGTPDPFGGQYVR